MLLFVYLDTPFPLAQLQQILHLKGPVQHWSKRINPMGVFSHFGQAEGAVIELQQLLDVNRFGQTIRNTFQMNPSVKLNLRIDEMTYENDGQFAGLGSSLAALTSLFMEMPGDAVVVTENDDLILHRREGRIRLNTACGFWTSSRMSLLGLPFDGKALDAVSWS